MAAPLCSICILLALSSSSAFFVDTDHPIVFQNIEPSFGHQMVQLDSRVIVSAPLQQTASKQTGRLYTCDPWKRQCIELNPSDGSGDGITMSLGLSLAAQETSSQLLACGPTLQRTCGRNIYVNGRCHQLSLRGTTLRTLPPSLPACASVPLDIVFLIDGSGSVQAGDFAKMLTFVSKVITSFSGKDAQFALMQYSYAFQTHFDFRTFSSTRDPTVLTRGIQQLGSITKTATAIHKVTTELFVASKGSRDKAVKILIVITDGETVGDNMKLEDSANEAKQKGIVCFAIGVGYAFKTPSAQKELKTIASSKDKMFDVTDFSALLQFQETLQDKIFAIEGTQSGDETSFEMEMSQEGFSAVLTQDGPILGTVGAYDWSGGFSVYPAGQHKGVWINATKNEKDMKEAYMGYSVQQVERDVIAVGAPRYRYTGRVLIYARNPATSQWVQSAAATGEQIGSYFGSVLSAVSGNPTSILVVGAPTYYSPEAPGGRVYLCPVSARAKSSRNNRVTKISCPETLQGDSNQLVGHFGSAISVLPDLTGDRLPDLAIGAPCEDNFKGAIYIFPGKAEGFRTSYIQRVTGSLLSSNLKFFGRSVSGNLDMTRDGLPDITVGGEGQVLVMRSRPVVSVSASMTVRPEIIPLSFYDCSLERRVDPVITLNVCFNRELRSLKSRASISAQVNYTLLLDAGRSLTRALFTRQPDTQTASASLMLTRDVSCTSHTFLLPECVEDFLTPLRVSLNFSLTGTPVLSEDSKTSNSKEVTFEKNCGVDGVCQDDLRVKINFTDVTLLVVGDSLDVNVTVSVRNEGEDSYNTRVLIPFPSGLSYRLSLTKNYHKATVSCGTLEGQRVVSCEVNKPRMKPKARVTFIVSFHVSPTAVLGDALEMTANVTSDNGGTPGDKMTSSARVAVLYAIYVTITSLEESSKYENFTSGDRTIRHVYRVNNLGERGLPLSIIFLLPVRLNRTALWEEISINSSQPQITECSRRPETAGAKNFQELIKLNPVVNCSVGWCLPVECKIHYLEHGSSVLFTVRGRVTRDWTTQTEQKKISLQSSAEIVYDTRTYHQNQHFTRAQAQTVLEVLIEYNYVPAIIGSSVSGLVLLALVTAALHKLGFFKRQYKEMLEDPGGEATTQGVEAPPEPQE